MPVQEIFYFDYDDLDFEDEEDMGDKQISYAQGRYSLSSNLGAENWASQYFNDITGLSLKIETTLVSFLETETEQGDNEVTLKLKHVVKNTTDKTVKMAFVFPDKFESARIVSSSIEPDPINDNTWVLELKPGQSRTLSYEMLVVE